MTATSHAVVAALLATKIQNPVVLVGVNLGAHFLLDLVPHWDPGTYFKKKSSVRIFGESAVDFSISLILAYIIYTFLGGSNIFLLYLGVFASQLPDFFSAAYIIFKWKLFLFRWSFDFQYNHHNVLDKPWGIVTQVGVIVILGLIIGMRLV
ncbi:MAG: hypothetical protein C4584_00525 [Armatimonadetes bacterium]|nr:MAG: hypothetical protein C4584_00525 [Armatimonadota bacterium]